MKIFKIILLAVVTTCLTFSCSSDDDNPTNEELIIGTWKWTASSDNGVADTLTECDLKDTYTFTSTTYSGTEHWSDNGSAPCESESYNGTYTIDGNIITWDNDDSEDAEEIVTLNSTTLVLKYVETYQGTTNVYLDTYTRQ